MGRSDSGERCEVKRRASPLYFSSLFLLRTALHYLNAWNRLPAVLCTSRVIFKRLLPTPFFGSQLRRLRFRKITSYEVSNAIQMNSGYVKNTPRDFDHIRLH